MSTARSLIRSLSLAGALALAFGCSSTGPAGQSGKGGTGQTTGLGGSAVAGRGGAQASGGSTGTAGQTGTGGTTASGTAGTTATGAGGQAGQSSTGAGGLATDGGYDGPNLGLGGGVSVTFGSTQCSDGIDNDGDGLIDYMDPECTGPLDNDEGTFATGIPGDNMDACKQDCFFDGNSGMGDDHCNWQLKCDPASTGQCAYSASYAQSHATECSLSASQPQQCIDFCRQRTPNGCDCFGCCVVPGAPTPIRLANTCTAKDFGDPTKCPVCTQVTQCLNPCERCEICIGKPTVPADCNGTPADAGTPPADAGTAPDAGGGVPQQCDFDAPSCGPQGQCDPGRGCVTGCCLVL
jgi:hypothetical protein